MSLASLPLTSLANMGSSLRPTSLLILPCSTSSSLEQQIRTPRLPIPPRQASASLSPSQHALDEPGAKEKTPIRVRSSSRVTGGIKVDYRSHPLDGFKINGAGSTPKKAKSSQKSRNYNGRVLFLTKHLRASEVPGGDVGSGQQRKITRLKAGW